MFEDRNTQKSELNILYFAPCGWREGVGGSARLKNILDVLGQLGANIQLLTYQLKSKFGIKHEQVSPHLRVTAVYPATSPPKLATIFSLLLFFGHGLKHIKRSTFVFAHSPSTVVGFFALVLAKMFKKPLIVDITDVKDPYTPKFIYNLVLKNSNAVFTVSQYLEEKAKEIGCRNVVCIPVIINSDAFQQGALERAEIREKLGIDDKEVVIGYAGSFWHIEGLSFLLKAFKKLHNEYENVKLVLVGGRNVPGSDDVPRLINELAISDQVILVLPQPHELMPKYLTAFDIACSPKIDCAENRAASPIKIHEYMSMGLPTVASAVGETLNIIENRYDGLLVKPGDENELQTTLEHVIQNLDSAREMGQRAREKVIGNHSQQAVQKKIKDVMEQLLRKGARN